MNYGLIAVYYLAAILIVLEDQSDWDSSRYRNGHGTLHKMIHPNIKPNPSLNFEFIISDTGFLIYRLQISALLYTYFTMT